MCLQNNTLLVVCVCACVCLRVFMKERKKIDREGATAIIVLNIDIGAEL